MQGSRGEAGPPFLSLCNTCWVQGEALHKIQGFDLSAGLNILNVLNKSDQRGFFSF